MSLEALLTVQEHDSATDHLRHQRAGLPERERLALAQRALGDLEPRLAAKRGERDEVVAAVRRLDDETQSVAAKATEVERTMYSGSVTSPRELQAMQADVEQLARHRRSLEDRELELMERQEALDAEVRGLEEQLAAAQAIVVEASAALAAQEAELDAEIARQETARDLAATDVAADLLARYERLRAGASNGVGVARLVGNTCQACRLTIPATEVDRLRRGEGAGEIATCDNCGAILVP